MPTIQPLRPFLVLLVFLLTAPGVARAQARIVFDAYEHDFGAFDEGDDARHVFTFRNTGDAPLHLQAVRPACGCTTPAWTDEAVPPGETGIIEVAYDSEGHPGPFRRSVHVVSNGEPGSVTLYIEGDVRARPLADTHRQGDLRFDRVTLDLGAVTRGIATAGRFRLQNAGEHPIRFLEVARAPENVFVSLPEDPLGAGSLTMLNVVVGTDALEAGEALDYEIVLRTDDEEQPLKAVRVTGRVPDAGGR